MQSAFVAHALLVVVLVQSPALRVKLFGVMLPPLTVAGLSASVMAVSCDVPVLHTWALNGTSTTQPLLEHTRSLDVGATQCFCTVTVDCAEPVQVAWAVGSHTPDAFAVAPTHVVLAARWQCW